MARPTGIIDMNAARRERAVPDGITVPFGEETFTLPAEMPLDIIDPWLAPDLDLVGIIRTLVDAVDSDDSADEDEDADTLGEAIVDLITDRPDAPAGVWHALHATYEALFGQEQYATFRAQRPSIPDYVALTRGLITQYGVSLGEAFASPASPKSDGATSKRTSRATTSSTRAKPGAARTTSAGSSGSDG